MTREELRQQLYEETGDWYDDQALSEFIAYHDIQNQLDDYSTNKSKPKSFIYTNEDESLSEDIVEDVSKIFSGVLKKAWKTASENVNLRELAYFSEIFICKCALYLILEQGNKKGYKWRDL